jgi:hypothetical protein
MPALTLADYMSITKRCLDEDPDLTSERFPDADIVARLNDAQKEIVREADLFFFRNTSSTNATTGDITPPTDYFSNASLTLVVNTTDRRPLPVTTAKDLYKKQPNWVNQTPVQYPSGAVIKNTPDGIRFVLNPPISAPITNGIFWEYAAIPADMEEADDECAPLEPFPELQATLLPAGALKALYLLDAGTSDLQWKKWDLFFQREMDRLRAAINDLYIQEGQYCR